jgi:nicotinamide-nucleotide amidase
MIIISKVIQQIAQRLRDKGSQLCTAESCTGGLIAKSFTDLAGSSDWFERGFVTYSNEAKIEMLAVPASVIQDYGAVSEAVAVAMANGALQFSRANYSIAVTGVAGPGGGSDEKPVGTVWIAVAGKDQTRASHFQFDGDREAVRNATLQSALEMTLELIDSN